MGNILRLTSPVPPSVNHYLGTRCIMKNGRPMAMVYETAEAKKYKKDFKEYVLEQVNIQNWDVPVNKTQHFYIDCVFYFERIDQDPNNYFKLQLDSLTETQALWMDDNVTCERVNRIYYDSKNPRIELTIYPVDYIGIFDSKCDLDTFCEKCESCKRNKRNCSIKKKAIEGRIQEEINMESFECSKYSEAKS